MSDTTLPNAPPGTARPESLDLHRIDGGQVDQRQADQRQIDRRQVDRYHVDRRHVLGLIGGGLAGMSLAAHPAAAQTTPADIIQTALGDGQRFNAAAVLELARIFARRPFVAPPNDLPQPFSSLSYERYIGIKTLPSGRLWDGENRGFVIEPLHRGFVFTNAVRLFTVEDGQVRRISYDRSHFDFNGIEVSKDLGDLNFSGFRLLSPFGDGPLTEFAIVQGATFFRALARGQNFGAVARALTLKPAEARGEEFPFFRAFWLERPSAGTNALVAHALLDSESVSGAVRMTFRPGEMTIVDVEMTLIPRVNLDHVGFGGMQATYFFGPNSRRNTDDVRAGVYESSGLEMLTGAREWVWRPLSNPETLQISVFLDENPRGFGLLQRDRDYVAFQDDDQRFERRPSLWVEPLGEWGQGAVQLLEIPSDSEVNDNILSYWRPKKVLNAGAEMSVAYRQFWCWSPPERPSLACVTTTRAGRGSGGRRRRFYVDFTGDNLAGPLPADFAPKLTTNPGTIQAIKTWVYPERKTVRVAFELDPGNETACELRLTLQSGGKPLSETWLYRWTP